MSLKVIFISVTILVKNVTLTLGIKLSYMTDGNPQDMSPGPGASPIALGGGVIHGLATLNSGTLVF